MGTQNLMSEVAFLGIKAPAFTWMMAIFIIVSVATCFMRMRRDYARGKSTNKDIAAAVAQFGTSISRMPGDGLTVAMLETLDKMFTGHPTHQPSWLDFRATLTRQFNVNGEDMYLASESASRAFGENSDFDSRINKGFYQAVPGIFTGIGLLVTFIAILLALKGVSKDPVTRQFTGIDQLISGLSGKFISSIAALLSASFYMFFEKLVSHGYERSRADLVNAIDRVIPRLNSPQILADMRNTMVEQSNAFRHFNADLSTRLQESFSASMEPTLERMVEAIESLDRFLRASESNKSQSMADQVKDLLTQVERSMTASLEEIGKTFSDSLSGNAMTEFDKIGKTLSQSAGLISQMNVQFEGTQNAIASLVEMAKASTQEQFALGRRQVEDITNTLKELMVQLRETSGASSSQMSAALLHATDTLSSKVNELSEKMSSVVLESAGLAQETASQVIGKAGEWTEQSNRTLAALLDRIQGHVDQTDRFKSMLDNSMASLLDVLTRYQKAITDMQRVAGDFSIAASTARETVDLVKATQETIRQTAALSSGQVAKLEETAESYHNTWTEIQKSMERYQRVFEAVEKASQRVLESVTQHLKNYSETTKNHFEGLVTVSNDHMSTMAGKISGAVAELESSISDLGDVLGRVGRPPGGRA